MSGLPTGEDLEEFARASVAAINERDHEFFRSRLDPDAVFHSAIGAVEGRVYRGRDCIKEFLADADSAFSDLRWELVEASALDDERALIELRVRGRGAESRIPVDLSSYAVVRWRDGKVWRFRVAFDRAAAIEPAPG